MSNRSALVIDDAEVNRSMLKSFLILKHFNVDTAPDGLQGFKAATSKKYDLIFSDVEMPNMNGLEFLSKFKKDPANKSVPVVMLTTLDSDEMIQRANRLGANAYMVKPFSKEKMDAVLGKLGLNT